MSENNNDGVFISILNSTIPVFIYIVVGFIIYKVKLFSDQRTLLNITFSYTFPISLIYSIGTIDLQVKDLKVVISFWLSSIIMVPFILIQIKLFDKERKILSFGHLLICIDLLNILITGLPLTQGFYDQQLTEKYSYIITFSQFVINFPTAFFSFAYGDRYYKSSPQQMTKKIVCQLIKQSILVTIKNPMVIGIILGLIYNLIRVTLLPQLKDLPYYFQELFSSMSVLTRTFGITPIGIFLGMQIQQLIQNKKDVNISMQDSQVIENQNDGLEGDENKNKEEKWSIKKQILYFLCCVLLRHVLFPIFGVIFLALFKEDKEVIKIISSLFTCNSAIQSFVYSDIYNIHASNAGFMILLGIIFDIIFTIIFKVILESIYQ